MSSLIHKTNTARVRKADGRTRTFIISTGNEDREHDVITPSGWDFSAWLRNPVVLVRHNYDAWPVARGSNPRVVGNNVYADATFAETPEADACLQLIDSGMLSGASVGFRPLEQSYDSQRGGTTFLRQELLEWSIVPVPANAEALVQRAQTLGLSANVIRKMFGPAAKSGRVLSTANEQRVRDAQSACRTADQHLADVLASMPPADDQPDDGDGKSILTIRDEDDADDPIDVTGLLDAACVAEIKAGAARRRNPMADPATRSDHIAGEPTIDVADVAAVLPTIIRETLATMVKLEIELALRRARGRVD